MACGGGCGLRMWTCHEMEVHMRWVWLEVGMAC